MCTHAYEWFLSDDKRTSRSQLWCVVSSGILFHHCDPRTPCRWMKHENEWNEKWNANKSWRERERDYKATGQYNVRVSSVQRPLWFVHAGGVVLHIICCLRAQPYDINVLLCRKDFAAPKINASLLDYYYITYFVYMGVGCHHRWCWRRRCCCRFSSHLPLIRWLIADVEPPRTTDDILSHVRSNKNDDEVKNEPEKNCVSSRRRFVCISSNWQPCQCGKSMNDLSRFRTQKRLRFALKRVFDFLDRKLEKWPLQVHPGSESIRVSTAHTDIGVIMVNTEDTHRRLIRFSEYGWHEWCERMRARDRDRTQIAFTLWADRTV